MYERKNLLKTQEMGGEYKTGPCRKRLWGYALHWTGSV